MNLLVNMLPNMYVLVCAYDGRHGAALARVQRAVDDRTVRQRGGAAGGVCLRQRVLPPMLLERQLALLNNISLFI